MTQYSNSHRYHVFKKSGRYFAFQVNTLVTFEVSKVCYELLKSGPIIETDRFLRSHHAKYKKGEIQGAIRELSEGGLISEHSIPNENVSDYKDENLLIPNADGHFEINGAYLVLTNRCNLRCKYCSADYGQFGSGDSKSQMTREIAKKSIDFIISHLNNHFVEPMIVFAGGEPLLNFDIMKFVVEYLETKPQYKPQYMFNTNGTLMNEDIARWLVEKKIRFRFSIDGTREIHNSNRVFANGRGSHDRVMKGVRNYLKFSKNGFSAQTSIPKARGLVRCVHALWDMGASDIVANLTAESVFIDDKRYLPQKNDWQRYIRAVEKLSAEICDNFINFGHSKVIQNSFKLIERVYKRQKRVGACGVCRVIAIDTVGRFYPCQGLVGFQEHVIGSLEKDFDFQKISKFDEEFSRYLLRCNNCWAKNICDGACIALSYQYHEMDSNFQPSRWCNFNRKIAENSIYLYNEIKERKPELFESLFSSY